MCDCKINYNAKSGNRQVSSGTGDSVQIQIDGKTCLKYIFGFVSIAAVVAALILFI